jgi:tetratricopeptide (TPR) repeat protein
MFRDWDDFAATGVALSLATAWLAGEALRAAPARAWLGAAVTLGVAVPTAQWLVLQHSVDHGMKRVEAYLTEAPSRSIGERALSWSYLSLRNSGLGRLDTAADDAARAAGTAPSPRLLYEWASAEATRGDLRKSQAVLRTLIAKAGTMPDAWSALALVSEQLGDTAQARQAAERLLALAPTDRGARELLARIGRGERAPGDSAR